jgi:ribosomal protein L7/L12
MDHMCREHLQAKDMVEGAPIVVKQGLKKDEAEKLMKLIVDAGAKAALL